MALEESIDRIKGGLERGVYRNEQAIRQSIINIVLKDLGWLMDNPEIVSPEYTVEGRRVDYALCHPELKPLVFIEAKYGPLEGAERQLFEYAFHEGIHIAVLTNGQKWQFFYTAGGGNRTERLVYELDIMQAEREVNVDILKKYLNYELVRTGEALKSIKNDHEKVLQQKYIEQHLSEAWNQMVENANEFLLEGFSDEIANLCGQRPTKEQMLPFLKNLKEVEPVIESFPNRTRPSTHHNHEPRKKEKGKDMTVTFPDETVFSISQDGMNQSKVFVKTIEKLLTQFGVRLVMEADYNTRQPHSTDRIMSTDSTFRDTTTRKITSTTYKENNTTYFITHDYGINRKKELLRIISNELGVQLKVN